MSSLLVVVAVIFAVVEFAPRSRAVEIVVALLVNLLNSRLNDLSPRVAHRLLRVALFTLPSYERDDQYDEWIDHLDAIGGSGLQTLTCAVGLIVRGLPRLACRSRLRQALNGLVPVGRGQIFVSDDNPERTLRPVQGSPEKPTRITFTATRYPVGITRLWRVDVFYFALIRADDPPEITRHAVVVSRLFPGALCPLVKRMGYVASDRRFAEAELLDIRQESAQPIPRAEIDRILNAGGRTTTKSVKMSPQRRFGS
jgi:hypothetical protein